MQTGYQLNFCTRPVIIVRRTDKLVKAKRRNSSGKQSSAQKVLCTHLKISTWQVHSFWLTAVSFYKNWKKHFFTNRMQKFTVRLACYLYYYLHMNTCPNSWTTTSSSGMLCLKVPYTVTCPLSTYVVALETGVLIIAPYHFLSYHQIFP